jgi:hypothetical protein
MLTSIVVQDGMYWPSQAIHAFVVALATLPGGVTRNQA